MTSARGNEPKPVRPVMTPAVVVIGSLIVFWASISLMVVFPVLTMHETPDPSWRPWTADEAAGNRLYVQNGCSYCHSQYVRINDWDVGENRISQMGDYYGRQPIILGTERVGPDLSQEGGLHPDDWHLAHFTDPRFTSPNSLMPSWEFLGGEKIRLLTAFVQALGSKDADVRVGRQSQYKGDALSAFALGPDRNLEWLHSEVPSVWLDMPNPYPADAVALLRGQKIYQDFCIGCHGQMGDGNGPAAAFLRPAPVNFTTVRKHLAEGRYEGGLFYYQVMNGVTGTAMPFLKTHLESEKIWDVSNFIAVSFVGYTDAATAPRGIPASYEGTWKNDFLTPAAQVEKEPVP